MRYEAGSSDSVPSPAAESTCAPASTVSRSIIAAAITSRASRSRFATTSRPAGARGGNGCVAASSAGRFAISAAPLTPASTCHAAIVTLPRCPRQIAARGLRGPSAARQSTREGRQRRCGVSGGRRMTLLVMQCVQCSQRGLGALRRVRPWLSPATMSGTATAKRNGDEKAKWQPRADGGTSSQRRRARRGLPLHTYAAPIFRDGDDAAAGRPPRVPAPGGVTAPSPA